MEKSNGDAVLHKEDRWEWIKEIIAIVFGIWMFVGWLSFFLMLSSSSGVVLAGMILFTLWFLSLMMLMNEE